MAGVAEYVAGHMPDSVDRVLALRWLASARRATIAAQIALMFFAEAGTEIHLHSPALVGILLGWGTMDVVQAFWFRRRIAPPRVVPVTAGLDFAALTGILVLSGGQHSPLLFGYLAYLALLAMVLPAAQAWAACAFAIALQAFVVFHPADVAGLPPHQDTLPHLVSHVLSFDVSAAAITWVVTRLSATLRERNAQDREDQRKIAITHRLAALGTLAAGVAHELGTPLGAIQLLGERARRNRPDAEPELATLLEQVARCRSILDRLRGRDPPGEADCLLDLDRWTQEWSRAVPDVDVALVHGRGDHRVLGSEGNWRAAVWVALDNARKAGARHVAIKVTDAPDGIELAIEDDGLGLDEAAVRHAGEPFWTGWGGTGLGLFVARSFAQSVGGDVVVEPAEVHGARVRILLPRSPA